MNAQLIEEQMGVTVLSEAEIEQVGGALAPLAAWALYAAGGVVIGFVAAWIAK